MNRPRMDVKVSIQTLEEKIQLIESQLTEIKKTLKDDPSMTVKKHITLLHEYNLAKDLGQALIGKYATDHRMTVKEAYQEFGVNIDD